MRHKNGQIYPPEPYKTFIHSSYTKRYELKIKRVQRLNKRETERETLYYGLYPFSKKSLIVTFAKKKVNDNKTFAFVLFIFYIRIPLLNTI